MSTVKKLQLTGVLLSMQEDVCLHILFTYLGIPSSIWNNF